MSKPIAVARSVRIAELSPPKKQALWAWIKSNDPGLAAFLTSPDVARISAAFPGSSVVVDVDYVQRAVQRTPSVAA